jgi:NADH dehydrogenase (ubiquinone) flavoprotein 2
MAFQFSSESLDKIAGILAKYPNKAAGLLPVLYVAQAQEGWVSSEAMAAAAKVCEVPEVKAREVATFYTMYNKKPVGRYHVQVCCNISCSLMGSGHIYDYLSKKLGIKAGETTSDKLFTLSKVECLGSCGTAPMMQVNDQYYEDLTPEKVDSILDGFK